MGRRIILILFDVVRLKTEFFHTMRKVMWLFRYKLAADHIEKEFGANVRHKGSIRTTAIYSIQQHYEYVKKDILNISKNARIIILLMGKCFN